ncbi:MAG TPA: hypothetical protein VNA89_15970, partial [Gemmatimonadaceae bacterium]|nr:hypothetical protein [Gemmatimonadaceae bacterium]
MPGRSPSTDRPPPGERVEREVARQPARGDAGSGIRQLLSPAARVLFLSAGGAEHDETLRTLL